MGRRIVFAGSAQTRALARIYRSEIAGLTGDNVVFIGTGAVGTDSARSTLLLADVLAMEVDEDGDAISAADLPGQAALVRIPNLYCDFLWPFAGRAHPRNRGAFALPGGPYPAEHGDRFLDQMTADGVDQDVAVARYLAMDIVQEGELDSRLADRLAIQRQLDTVAGYDLAGFIADNFRTEPLFRTRQRMTMTLLRRVTAQFFTKLGVQNWHPDSLRRVPFPAGAQPIHPGVIAHFGLTWVAGDQEYPINEEGFFGFDAFCRRYMQFDWNETLHRGIQTAKTNPGAALDDLEKGLQESPESRLGLLARDAARRAAGLDHSSGDPRAIIDEDSYDLDLEAEPLAQPVEAVHSFADPEAYLLAAAAPNLPARDAPAPDPEDTAPSAVDATIGSTAEDDLIADAAPTPASDTIPEAPAAESTSVVAEPAVAVAKPPVPVAEPAISVTEPERRLPRVPVQTKSGNLQSQPSGYGGKAGADHGFTDFRPVLTPEHAIEAAPDADLIEALPKLLPLFAELASDVDRPFGAMPEVMPPPPLRPILPPELQGEAPRPGLLARMLGRR